MCESFEPTKPEMPEEGSVINFKNFKARVPVPFTIQTDFESTLTPTNTKRGENTHQHDRHDANSYFIYLHCHVDPSKSREYELFKDADPNKVTDNFVASVKQIAIDTYQEHYQFTEKMNDTVRPLSVYRNDPNRSDVCWLCQDEARPINWDYGKVYDYISTNSITIKKERNELLKDTPVRDHCHVTGNFRGIAHQSCNLQCSKTNAIPIIMHNMGKYDSHLFIRALARSNDQKGKDINVIAQNIEHFKTFSIDVNVDTKVGKNGKGYNKKIRLQFKDSLQFLNASLDKLAQGVPDDEFHVTRKHLPTTKNAVSDEKKFRLLRKKGIYPYEWMDNFDKFKATELPPVQAFISKLTSDITVEEYEHVNGIKIIPRRIGREKYRQTDKNKYFLKGSPEQNS